MRAIFQSLPGLIDEMPSMEAQEAIVFAIWPTVLGEHLRERSAPISFDSGILLVAVSNRDWKREFDEHASQILFKLNRAFGKPVVDRVETVVDGKTVERLKQKPTEMVESRSDLLLASIELKAAAGKIANAELRTHFLEAAAACIRYRDAK